MWLSRNELINGSLRIENRNVIDEDGDTVLENLTSLQIIKLERGLNHPYFWAAPVLLGKPW